MIAPPNPILNISESSTSNHNYSSSVNDIFSLSPDGTRVKGYLPYESQVKAVADFIDGLVLFVLSKSFSDLIGAFIFGLYPIPYCGDYLGIACKEEASSKSQFYYAGGLLLFAALLKNAAESSPKLQSIPGMNSVPAMVSMIGPWAVGAAFTKLLREIEVAHPSVCSATGDCSNFNFGFTLLATLIAGGLIIIVQPLTKEIQFGSGDIVDFFEVASRLPPSPLPFPAPSPTFSPSPRLQLPPNIPGSLFPKVRTPRLGIPHLPSPALPDCGLLALSSHV